MSRQINLFHPRYLAKREWLTLNNVAIVCAVLVGGMVLAGTWAWSNATARSAEAAIVEASLMTIKSQLEAQTQAVASRQPSPQLAAEIGQAEELLARRGQIVRLLESGAIGGSGGFSEYLRGFARQTTSGLWLTGFAIGSGGDDMEIHGRMANSAALPEYIRRLGGEQVFQGRSFSALTLNRPASAAAPSAASVSAPGAAEATAAPPPAAPDYVEFVLTPRREDAGGKQ